MNFPKRTHTCGELRLDDAGSGVVLNGWIETRRDLGNLIFLDLRDRYGVTQVELDTSTTQELMAIGKELRPEFVIAVTGQVRARPEQARNPGKETGDIEVVAEEILVLNASRTPPFEITESTQVADEIRMRYRYLDMRRKAMRDNLVLRHEIVLAMRNAFASRDFIEIETPLLTKSTPEGARDFLVPSRLQKGRFYALPQSPQLFKQILMVGGMDRYFQIVKCIRDEDLRADRQPEFTQLDVEMSFVEEEEVFDVLEEVMVEALKAAGKGEISRPFPRMTYSDAMRNYGTDKPDTRFEMTFFDLTEFGERCEFKVFRKVVEDHGAILGITAPGCASYSRKDIDHLGEFVAEKGAKGLAWFKVGEDGLSSSIAKFFEAGDLSGIQERAGAQAGDLILIIAGPLKKTRLALSELRIEMGRRLDLRRGSMAISWVTEFPMFEKDDETGELVPSHHPFTTPKEEYEGHLEKEPASLKARAYDLVLNGVELGSGSVRIHHRELQSRVFKILGIDEEEARLKFGFLLDAFEYGAPPHAGIALGLDRLVMLLAGMTNIREVIAFPKTASGMCPMTGAPTPVDAKLLDELGLRMKDQLSAIR